MAVADPRSLSRDTGIRTYERRGRPSTSASSWTLTAAVRKEIESSDIILAIITSRVDRVEAELSYAMGLKKVIIPIVYEGTRLPPLFDNCQVFWFSPFHSPGNLEAQIIACAIITVGLGLPLLSAVAKE